MKTLVKGTACKHSMLATHQLTTLRTQRQVATIALGWNPAVSAPSFILRQHSNNRDYTTRLLFVATKLNSH